MHHYFLQVLSLLLSAGVSLFAAFVGLVFRAAGFLLARLFEYPDRRGRAGYEIRRAGFSYFDFFSRVAEVVIENGSFPGRESCSLASLERGRLKFLFARCNHGSSLTRSHQQWRLYLITR